MKRKTIVSMLFISIIPLLLICITMPETKMFASQIDWISQHVSVPDYFRSLFLETGNLFPDYAPHLQAGANIYDFAYYGLFRPDVLISYALPMIEMKTIIIFYSIFLIILGGNLLYIWLRKKEYANVLCIFAALLYMTSSIFFQSHRQIMFVNFMPFLLLALMSIDYFIKTKKTTRLTLSIILIILHSYFFSIAAIIVCFIYFFYETHKQNKSYKPYCLSLLTAVGIAIITCAILLLPTAFVILENSKSVAATSFMQLWIPNLSLQGLLYDPYGCGLPMIAWAILIIGCFHKRTRIMSIILLTIFLLPFLHFVLNGFLYARTKILIVFLPLILYQLCEVVTLLAKQKIKIKWTFIIMILLPIFCMKEHLFVAIDCVFTIMIILAITIYANKKIILVYTLAIVIVFINMNPASLYLDKKQYENTNAPAKDEVLKNSEKQRVADFTTPLYSSNQVYNMQTYRTSSYTSTNNSLYNAFLYDVMNQSIRIVNRVANVDEANPFVQGLLGVKGLISNTKVPVGYQLKKQIKKIKYYENKDVLPIAYATSNVMSESAFDKLKYPYTLDTIYNNAITKKGNSTYRSQIQKLEEPFTILKQSKHLQIDSLSNGYHIKAKKDATLQLGLDKQNQNQILIISFDVNDIKNADRRETSISINQIKNKLSKTNANYPNQNEHFTFVVSSNHAIESLNIAFSKGEYSIQNINIHALEYDVIKNRKQEVDALQIQETKNKEVLKGSINVQKDGYFVTSLAYQKGYTAYVEDKQVPIEVVNKAFVGFPIKKGSHQIRIVYEAPYKNIALLLSGCGVLALCLIWLFERRNKNA